MEFNKINNFLGTADDKVPKFITTKWIKVHHKSSSKYDPSKEIRFKKSMLRSDLCDYSEVYIWVKGDVTVDFNQYADELFKKFVFKNNAPFISCISKINGKLVKIPEDLDVVMPMYNLLEYSKNYQKTSG